MKLLQIISAFIILTNLIACEPPVIFTEPQPTRTDNLSKFPSRLQGRYLSLDDKSTLLIGEKSMQRVYDFNYKFHPNQLDSASELSGNTVINLKTNQKIAVKRIGDSLVAHMHYIDTIFQISQDNVIRRFKGFYFLNTRHAYKSWEVKKIQLKKKELVMGKISTKLDLENLKEITKNPQKNGPPYIFKPSKKQFRIFVKGGGFRKSEIFIKKN